MTCDLDNTRRATGWQPRRAVAYCVVFATLVVIELAGSLEMRGLALFAGVALSTVAAAGGVRRHRPAPAGAWRALVAAVGVFCVGTLATTIVTPHLDRRPGLVLFPYLVLVAGHLLEVGAVIGLIRASSRRRDPTAVLDTIVLAIPAAAIMVGLVVAPLLASSALPAAERITLAAFPALAVVAAALLARLICARSRPPVALVLILVSLLASTFSSSWLALLSAAGRPVTLGFMALGWLAASAFLGAAATHPSMAAAGDPDRDDATSTTGGSRLVVLGVAVLLIPVTVGILRLTGRTPPGILIVGLSLALVLLLARIHGLLRLAAGDRMELHHRERYLGSVLANASDLILVLGPDGRVQYQSGPLDRFVVAGHDAEPVGSLVFVHADATPEAWTFFARALSRPGETVRTELLAAANGDDSVWLDVALTNLLDDPVVRGVVAVIRDMSARRRLEAELQRLAFHDSLTGLPNRALLHDRITHAVDRIGSSAEVALLFIDLDRFKSVNDSLGHHVGDELLKAVSARLAQAVRPSDTLARLGGDEFAIFVENGTGASALADRVLEVLRPPVTIDDNAFSVTASIGVVSGSRCTAADFLRDADLAMYRAKFRGGDQAAIYQPEMRVELTARLVTERDMRAGIEAEQFVVHYQPEIDLVTGKIRSVEALVRWNHPTRGLLPPGEFIEIAETTGLIVPLGKWVLRTATAQASAWRQAGIDVALAVNMSVKQLDDPRVVSIVLAALDSSGLEPGALTLEITESLLLADADTMIRRLNALKAIGVRLAIDDFGTGYSSLSYLRRFPIDTLKIDRSFISPLGDTPEAGAILRAQLDLARALDLDTVAEGVELESQLDILVAEGCASAQGFHFSRPLSAAAATALLGTKPMMLPLISGASR